jgi:hypothetical protein
VDPLDAKTKPIDFNIKLRTPNLKKKIVRKLVGNVLPILRDFIPEVFGGQKYQKNMGPNING